MKEEHKEAHMAPLVEKGPEQHFAPHLDDRSAGRCTPQDASWQLGKVSADAGV